MGGVTFRSPARSGPLAGSTAKQEPRECAAGAPARGESPSGSSATLSWTWEAFSTDRGRRHLGDEFLPASIWSCLPAPGAGERPGGRGGSGGLLAELDPFELGVGHDELPNLFGLAVLLVLPNLEEPG